MPPADYYAGGSKSLAGIKRISNKLARAGMDVRVFWNQAMGEYIASVDSENYRKAQVVLERQRRKARR